MAGLLNYIYRAFQVACNCAMQCSCSHMMTLKLSSQLIGQFGHMTVSASCKQPEKYGSHHVNWDKIIGAH